MQNSHDSKFIPLATRMRPRTIDEFVGQSHLLARGKPLRNAIEHGHLHSMILWGPPGTGKTTLADIIAQSSGARVEKLSAVLSGVKDIREVVQRAKEAQAHNKATVLFVDEVHRFNKAQQDAFLPHVEQGVITLIGATTENPSFYLNNALLSRARVYVLKPLNEEDLLQILNNAITDKHRGLGRHLEITDDVKKLIVRFADGDARQCLNILEILNDWIDEENIEAIVTEEMVREIVAQGFRRFDNGGEEFYNQISALHKAVRGSDPDAALYWLARMLDGGCDPLYIARRAIRIASEDIGNADPRGLHLAIDACLAYERLGTPEGELMIAHAITYLACAAKSNAVYVAFNRAMADAKEYGSLEVPLHIRNAPTSLMKQLDYGKNYRYAHDEPDAFAAGEHYFPEEMSHRDYYQPPARGLEIQIQQKLTELRKQNLEAKKKNKK